MCCTGRSGAMEPCNLSVLRRNTTLRWGAKKPGWFSRIRNGEGNGLLESWKLLNIGRWVSNSSFYLVTSPFHVFIRFYPAPPRALRDFPEIKTRQEIQLLFTTRRSIISFHRPVTHSRFQLTFHRVSSVHSLPQVSIMILENLKKLRIISSQTKMSWDYCFCSICWFMMVSTAAIIGILCCLSKKSSQGR